MSRGNGAKKLKFDFKNLNHDICMRSYRKILYAEIKSPRYSSLHDATIHFFLLDDDKMDEYELKYADAPEAYRMLEGFLDRYMVADMFRMYKFSTNGASYRVLIRKGVELLANNDLGGFVYQNYKNSLLISPREREVFERLREDLANHTDGTAQLVKVGRLLQNQKFLKIHEEYFGRIGVASLMDGSTIKFRYADSIMNNNVVTDVEMFREYLDRVNAIPMSDFTDQSVISQLANQNQEAKQTLMENYSNFLFMDDDEIDFACILLSLFLHAEEIKRFSTEDWVTAINDIRLNNDDIFLHIDESLINYKRELSLFRARYLLEKVSLPKLVHFLYDFFDFSHLSKNIGTLYPRLNELIGEDIREKFSQLETVNVSLSSYQNAKNPCDFFNAPQLVNFATAADKEIQKQIISGKYDHNFAAYYLCNYMQVADYKKYTDVLPAVVSIIKELRVENGIDFNLFWMAGDLLNEFWKLIPEDNKELNDEVESLIYDIYWPRISDAWPIIHRKKVKYEKDIDRQVFDESLGWICSISNDKLYDAKLRKYLKEAKIKDVDISDSIDKKIYNASFDKKSFSLKKYFGENGHEKEWLYAALYSDILSDKDIALGYILNLNCSDFATKESRLYMLEQWLLKSHDKERVGLVLYNYFVEHLGVFETYCESLAGNKNDAALLIYRSFAAMCESASNEDEEKVLEQFMKDAIASNETLARDYGDKMKRMLNVASANVRQTHFQYKNITIEQIKKLH